LPASRSEYGISDTECRGVGGDDFADGTSNHDVTNIDASSIRLRLRDPASHVGVKGEPLIMNEYLSRPRGGYWAFLKAEVGRRHPTLGSAGENNLVVKHRSDMFREI
jgi:hypothetical protein